MYEILHMLPQEQLFFDDFWVFFFLFLEKLFAGYRSVLWGTGTVLNFIRYSERRWIPRLYALLPIYAMNFLGFTSGVTPAEPFHYNRMLNGSGDRIKLFRR